MSQNTNLSDEANFVSSGGTSHPGYGVNATQFAMDNVTIQAAIGPQLSIVYTGTNTTVVSWPAPSTGWRLQQTSPLSPSSWATPPESVFDNFSTKYIFVNPAASNQFYRLVYP